MGDADGRRIFEDARSISFPRAAGSEGGLRARRIVVDRFRQAGLDVREEPFSYDIRPAFRAIRTVLVTSALLVAGSGALALRSVPLALVLLLGGALVGGAILVWSPGVERLYSGEGPKRTANVVARRPARNRRMTLVLLAHYDSKSQNLTLPWRMGSTVLAIVGGLALGALLVLGALWGVTPGPAWLPPACGGASAAALLILSTLKNGNVSPGGTDNAGSVGILLELARLLPGEIDGDVELIFLSPSAEEDHMVGVMRWLDAHREELQSSPVVALNMDGAGSPGKAVIMEWFGAGKSFGPRVAAVAREAARSEGIPLRRIWLPPAIGVDAIPFRHRGIECPTLSSGSIGRATIAVHSAGDVAENLDVETLQRLARLARATATGLAARDPVGATAPR